MCGEFFKVELLLLNNDLSQVVGVENVVLWPVYFSCPLCPPQRFIKTKNLTQNTYTKLCAQQLPLKDFHPFTREKKHFVECCFEQDIISFQHVLNIVCE